MVIEEKELKQTYNLAKKQNTSSYLIERPQISGKNSIVEQEFNNKVAILEEDFALSVLLSTSLSLKGFNAKKLSTIEEIEDYKPALIILDTGDDEQNFAKLELCKTIKSNNSKIKIISTSIFHNKEKIMNAGADIYLPKPYNIQTLTDWAEVAIKEFNK